MATAGHGAAGEEMVDVVDADNRPVDCVPRSHMRRENLRHRATYIFVFAGDYAERQLVVQLRTDTKDYCPGHYDLCFGGVVQAGEDYAAVRRRRRRPRPHPCADAPGGHRQSAARELMEEAGLGLELEPVGTFLHEDGATRVWGALFRCRYDGDVAQLTLQSSEVQRVAVMHADRVVGLAQSGAMRVTPDSLHAWRELQARLAAP